MKKCFLLPVFETDPETIIGGQLLGPFNCKEDANDEGLRILDRGTIPGEAFLLVEGELIERQKKPGSA